MQTACRPYLQNGQPVLLSTKSDKVGHIFQQYDCMQFTGTSNDGLMKFVYIGEALRDTQSAVSWEYVCLKLCKVCRVACREKAIVCHCCAGSNFAIPLYPGHWQPKGSLPPLHVGLPNRCTTKSGCGLKQQPAKKPRYRQARRKLARSWHNFVSANIVPNGAKLALRLRPNEFCMVQNGTIVFRRKKFFSPTGVASYVRHLCKKSIVCNGYVVQLFLIIS